MKATRKSEKPIRRGLTKALDLPADVLLHEPMVSVDGRRKLTVENHKGVEEFDGENLAVKTSVGVLRITGVSLVLEDLGCGSLLLTGEIKTIEWM
mgnify:CR=1 FL=1